MNRQTIWQILQENIIHVFPKLSHQGISENDSLKELGANSIDRAEIIMMTMSRMKLRTPLVTFAAAKNLGELLDILYREYQTIFADA